MTTRGDPAQLARLRAIIHQTRDALQAFLDEPQQPKGQGPVTDGEKHSVKGTDTVTTTLERLLPEYDQREVHSRWINAEPTVVWAALHEATAADLPFARVLMRIRSGGRTHLAGPLLELRPALQPLGKTEGREIVAGLISQAWRLIPRTKKVSGGQEAFAAFNEPGWVKVGIDIRLIPERGGTRLRTETRCKATDGRARMVFGMYWVLIRAGSGLIRRETLAAVCRRAEQTSRMQKGADHRGPC